MKALQAEVGMLRDQIEEVTRLVHAVRDHQLRRRLTNDRHMKKTKKKKEAALALGNIPIPVRGAINDNALKARGFEAHIKKWAEWLQAEADKDDIDAGRFLRRLAADWNRAFEQLAATKSGGY